MLMMMMMKASNFFFLTKLEIETAWLNMYN